MAAMNTSAPTGAPSFLVRFSERFFFTRRDESGPRGSIYPSAGTHLAYNDADEICRRVRDLGYPDAVVTDRQGQPVTEVPVVEESFSSVDELWGKEVSDQTLMALLRSKEPSEVAADLGMSLSELRARMDAIGKHLKSLTEEVHEFTSGKRELRKCNEIEHEERRANQWGQKK